jgi:hypothetical protein
LTCFSQINEAKTPVNTSTPAVADVILRGGPEERGASHGAHLQEKIEGVVDFYSGSLPEAKTRISEAGAGRSGNLLVGAAEGEALAVEFRADASYELADDNGVYLHTNHYRGCDLRTGTPEQRANSEQRLARAGALAAASDEYSHQTMNELLSDCAHAEHPICSSYREHPGIPALLGTICTLIMDLPGRKLSLRRGNDPANGYTEYSL